jgi:hypothetical protein
MKPIPLLVGAVLLAAVGAGLASRSQPGRLQSHPLQAAPLYPFGSVAFDTLIRDSESETPAAQRSGFEAWLAAAYARIPKAQLAGFKTLPAALEARSTAYRKLGDVPAKVSFERETGAWLHRMVKAAIPKFSLDRGFEFTNTVALGERQCLLQSVLIAGLLQRIGMDAGTVMIWRSLTGATSNLGHVSTLLRLSNGAALLVDASEPMPFPTHQGVFTLNKKLGQYQFLTPKFDAKDNITGFDQASVADLEALPYSYVRSQFYFYRGERTPGAFVNKPLTASGLQKGIASLKRAVQLEPQNPLAQYVLGHLYQNAGQTAAANAQFKLSHALYAQFGFVPSGVQSAFDGIKP